MFRGGNPALNSPGGFTRRVVFLCLAPEDISQENFDEEEQARLEDQTGELFVMWINVGLTNA